MPDFVWLKLYHCAFDGATFDEFSLLFNIFMAKKIKLVQKPKPPTVGLTVRAFANSSVHSRFRKEQPTPWEAAPQVSHKQFACNTAHFYPLLPMNQVRQEPPSCRVGPPEAAKPPRKSA